MALPIDFQYYTEEEEELGGFIPNIWKKEPTVLGSVDRSYSMMGMCMMATRDIWDGEEIFVNYRFNPNAIGLPDWYTPVKDGADEARWGDYDDIK